MPRRRTAMLMCGCSTPGSMLADNTWMALTICNRHLQLPEVQQAKVEDVWRVILEHNVLSAEGGQVWRELTTVRR